MVAFGSSLTKPSMQQLPLVSATDIGDKTVVSLYNVGLLLPLPQRLQTITVLHILKSLHDCTQGNTKRKGYKLQSYNFDQGYKIQSYNFDHSYKVQSYNFDQGYKIQSYNL